MTDNRIKEHREAKGVKQDGLAAMIGLSKSAVSRIENGETKLDLGTARRIATALNVGLEEILGIDRAQAGMQEEAAAYVANDGDPLSRLEEPSRHRFLYVAKSDCLDEIGIRSGDVLLVDASPEVLRAPLKPLAVVIAQIYDPGEFLQAITVMRQFVPPAMLNTNSRKDNLEPVNMRARDVRIAGVVVSRHARFDGNVP